MKRGRRSMRQEVYSRVIGTLEQTNAPITIFFISKAISAEMGKKISWNTIQKYVQELVESGRIQAIQLPPSKQSVKSGLIVYALKK
jgi:hypothetical protein